MKLEDIYNKLHFLKNYQHNIELKINKDTLDELRRYNISYNQNYLKFLRKKQ